MQMIEINEEIIETAMKMILHAGDARLSMMEVYDLLEEDKFDEVDVKLKEMGEHIDLSHRFQTSIVQKEANGEEIQYSILFTHAQDILMTVQSQYILTKRIARLFKKLKEYK